MTCRCERSAPPRGSAGSSAPFTTHTGCATGRCMYRWNRRPSPRKRERNSHRWYSSAQCGAGHSRMAAWYVATVSSSGNVDDGLLQALEVAAEEPRRGAGEPALRQGRHLHREQVPQGHRVARAEAGEHHVGVRRGDGAERGHLARVQAAAAQATYPPQPCPTSTALRSPSALTTPATSGDEGQRVVAAGRLVRAAVPAQVHRDRPVAVRGEGADLVAPGPPELRGTRAAGAPGSQRRVGPVRPAAPRRRGTGPRWRRRTCAARGPGSRCSGRVGWCSHRRQGYFRWSRVLVSCAWWIARSGARTCFTFFMPRKPRRPRSAGRRRRR